MSEWKICTEAHDMEEIGHKLWKCRNCSEMETIVELIPLDKLDSEVEEAVRQQRKEMEQAWKAL